MSRVPDDIEDYSDEEPLILDDPEEIAELEAAIEEADAQGDEGWVDADVLIRQMRERARTERERRG